MAFAGNGVDLLQAFKTAQFHFNGLDQQALGVLR
jgi:hypothetical protein